MQENSYLWRIPLSRHNGLVARAAPGTHEAVASHVARLGLDKAAKVLDCAAGTGALLSRIKSLGFHNLTAIERDQRQFGLEGVEAQPFDLNKDFASSLAQTYDLITAIEIIEHLDCPRHFLDQLVSCLAPGGYMILSTPNIAHWLGRLQFFFRGEFKYFTYRDYVEQRHISPILDLHMKIMIREASLNLMTSESTASSWGTLIKILTYPISAIFRLLARGNCDGNINLYVVRKPMPE